MQEYKCGGIELTRSTDSIAWVRKHWSATRNTSKQYRRGFELLHEANTKHTMSGRFFAGSSGSDSDSSSDSGSDSDNEEVKGKVTGGKNQWNLSSSDSDSEDEGRVVKSGKTKRFEALQTTTEDIKKKIRINDWNQVLELNIKLEKTVKSLANDFKTEGVPSFYLKVSYEFGRRPT